MPIDPVCGMEVDENTRFKVEYSGKVYYFCSPGCKAEFEADPGRYVRDMEGHSHHDHHEHSRRNHRGMHFMGGCHH